MIGNADRELADGRLATFAIVKRPSPREVALLGTGFYIQIKGGFATAAHVALEAQELLSQQPGSVCIAHTLPDGRSFFLPIWKFFIHPRADVAFGIPAAEFVNDRTGEVCRPKVLCLTEKAPDIGAPISTWAYPLHRLIDDETTGQTIQLQPTFYNGTLQELYRDRGPSRKLMPPYYLTDIHLYGGASGGPVFNESGEVFGLASSSYDGAENIAYVTPANSILDIEVPERISVEEDRVPLVSLRAVAARGMIAQR
jgi:hypothetical protein